MFSLPVGTEMFHFPTFPPHALCVQARVTPHDWCGVPPFGHPRINARLAAPRGLSQPPTSFIGSWCPGIHRVPLTTWPHNYNKPHAPHRPRTTPPKRSTPRDRRLSAGLQSKKMLASTVQFSTTNRPPPGHAPPNPTTPSPQEGRRRRVVRGPERPRHEFTDHPDRRTLARPPPGGPLPQDPTACLRPERPRTAPFPTAPEGPAVLEAAAQLPAELVSVPPSSTTPHTGRTPADGHRSTAWARLCTTTPTGAAARCSLERR